MKLFIAVALAVLTTAYGQEVHVCTGRPTGVFVRDISRCDGWFRCEQNGPVAGNCPAPFLFNEPIQECDWDYNVQCFQCPQTQPIHHERVPGSCTQFIRCINNVASQHACQNGLQFNTVTSQCDLPANVGCTVASTCPPNIPPGQMVTFRSDTDCSVFFTCISGQTTPPTQSQCNAALHFDPVRQQCVFPNQTDCQIGGPPGDDLTTPNPGDPPTTQPPFTCTGDGHFRHPTDCSQFIICAAGRPTFFSCADGLHFNPTRNQCDLPANSGCA